MNKNMLRYSLIFILILIFVRHNVISLKYSLFYIFGNNSRQAAVSFFLNLLIPKKHFPSHFHLMCETRKNTYKLIIQLS